MKRISIMKVLVYVALFVSPMGASAFNFEIAGVQMSLLRMAILLILIGTFALYGKGSFIQANNLAICNHRNRYSVIFHTIWFLWALLSALWARDLDAWAKTIYFLFIYNISIYLFINYFKTANDIFMGLKSLLFGTVIQSLIGWYEIFTKDYRFIPMTEHHIDVYITQNTHYPIAMTGNPNDFALMMLVATFIAYICLYHCKTKLAKLLYIGICISNVALIFTTTSRSGILGLMLGCIMVLYIRKKVKLLVVPALFLIIFYIPQIVNPIRELLQFDFAATAGSDFARVNIIKDGLEFLTDTVGFGVGAGQIEFWLQNNSEYYTENMFNMHNWWMELLTAYGLPIFLGYLAYYVKMFWDNYNLARAVQVNALEKTLSLSVCAIMAGFIIACLGPSSIIDSEWLWMFWGMCIAYQGCANAVSLKHQKQY